MDSPTTPPQEVPPPTSTALRAPPPAFVLPHNGIALWIAGVGGILAAILLHQANLTLDHEVPDVAAAKLYFWATGLLAIAVLVATWWFLGPLRSLFWPLSSISVLGLMPAWLIATDYGREGSRDFIPGEAVGTAMYIVSFMVFMIVGGVLGTRRPRTAAGWFLGWGLGTTGGVLLAAIFMVTSFSAQLEAAKDANRTPLDIVVDMVLILLGIALILRPRINAESRKPR